jgi:membrane protease YdiL (CAAX protease family)
VTLPFSPADVLRGIVLCVAATVFYVLVWVAVALLAPGFVHRAAAVPMGGALSWWAAALLMVINPVAEELLYLGVVANVLRSRSYAAALFVSVLVRVAVHLYQGPLAVLAIAPVGLISTTYYLDTRRMWPPVIAHAIMDIVALRHWVTWAA